MPRTSSTVTSSDEEESAAAPWPTNSKRKKPPVPDQSDDSDSSNNSESDSSSSSDTSSGRDSSPHPIDEKEESTKSPVEESACESNADSGKKKEEGGYTSDVEEFDSHTDSEATCSPDEELPSLQSAGPLIEDKDTEEARPPSSTSTRCSHSPVINVTVSPEPAVSPNTDHILDPSSNYPTLVSSHSAPSLFMGLPTLNPLAHVQGNPLSNQTASEAPAALPSSYQPPSSTSSSLPPAPFLSPIMNIPLLHHLYQTRRSFTPEPCSNTSNNSSITSTQPSEPPSSLSSSSTSTQQTGGVQSVPSMYSFPSTHQMTPSMLQYMNIMRARSQLSTSASYPFPSTQFPIPLLTQYQMPYRPAGLPQLTPIPPHLRPGANNGTAASPWTAQDPPPLSVQPPSSSSQQQDSLSNLENPTSSQQ